MLTLLQRAKLSRATKKELMIGKLGILELLVILCIALTIRGFKSALNEPEKPEEKPEKKPE